MHTESVQRNRVHSGEDRPSQIDRETNSGDAIIMDYQIIEEPITFDLFGKSASVPDNNYGEVGLRLMDDIWATVRNAGLSSSGINYWVYPSAEEVFVALEFAEQPSSETDFRPLKFTLHRYLKHIHIGPYQELRAKWKSLHSELTRLKETTGPLSLEIYGHDCENQMLPETTVLIGLE